MRLRPSAAALAAAISVALLPAAPATAQDPSQLGQFSAPFEEPTIAGTATEDDCLPEDAEGHNECKPTAGTINLLPDGRLLYFNALENTEDVEVSIVAEYGQAAINDQTRVLDLAGEQPTWFAPETLRGGANPLGADSETILPPGLGNDAGEFDYNDGSLFCADVTMLADGSILAVGGTDYYNEPVGPTGMGQVELEGLKSSRIFDPATDDWSQTDDMEFGRWYPTTVTLPDGDVFVAGGVQKLIKPLYTTHPGDSGQNVRPTEIYDIETRQWATNPASAEISLPLFPRLHLLPNGDVYYAANGQTYNPQGQSVDEALWNIAKSYDRESQTWTDLGIPGVGTVTTGYRGSTFSTMLPLRPDADGAYSQVQLLAAGGVLGTTPGAYFAIPNSLVQTVDTSGATPAMTSAAVGSLNNARWYPSGVGLPDGSVMAFSGATADEVVNPGSGQPVMVAERFDPATGTWTEMATQGQARTYHNTAVLLPDATVLVGGHAPISTAYLNNTQLPGNSPPNHDPTFEIYSPPYLFRGARPEITAAPGTLRHGQTFELSTPQASTIASVVLVRNATTTHLVDADQRTVELRILEREGDTLTLAMPDANVVPPGQYMLFANDEHPDGDIPSVAQQVRVGARADIERLAGVDRVATAAQVSLDSFATARDAVLARADLYPDALTGAPLATALDAPLLLTESDRLSEPTAQELFRLGVERVTLLGGEAALAPAIVADLVARGIEVDRVGGANRFDTAALIAEELAPTSGRAFLAEGANADPDRGWPDALSAAPFAAFSGEPVLLATAGSLPQESADALESLAIEETVIVGGEAAVGPGVMAAVEELGAAPRRVAGADRYATAVAVYGEAVAAGMSPADLWLATGLDWPDSLTAGPAVAAAGGTFLLVDGQSLDASPATRQVIEATAALISQVHVVGGEHAVAPAVVEAVRAIIER